MVDRIRIPEVVPACPVWAGGFGVGGYGVFADLVVGESVYRMRWIVPGRFQMGSADDEMGAYGDEEQRHAVRIAEGFWLGETPMTQVFYESTVGENPSRFEGEGQRPVERVSWGQSREFCRRLSRMLPKSQAWRARLPSEAEWEYACRAGSDGPLYSGKPLTSETGRCPNLDELAWYYQNSGNTTHPVKEKLPNVWGLYDMLGNVWEWCEDHWHDDYNGAPDNGEAWVMSGDVGGGVEDEGRSRVIRGGAWSIVASGCRAAFRNGSRPGDRDGSVGFRLVLAPSSTGQSVPSLEQGRD